MDYVAQMAKAGASGFTFHVEVAQGILPPFQTIPHLLMVLTWIAYFR
jgi:pentose-5-phosphate-3-epimerase